MNTVKNISVNSKIPHLPLHADINTPSQKSRHIITKNIYKIKSAFLSQEILEDSQSWDIRNMDINELCAICKLNIRERVISN